MEGVDSLNHVVATGFTTGSAVAGALSELLAEGKRRNWKYER